MLYCIDVGNTNITMCLFKGDEILDRCRIKTKVRRTSDEYGFNFQSFLQTSHVSKEEITGIVISSVVPKLMHALRNGVVKYFGLEPLVVNSSLEFNIGLDMDNLSTLGTDRLADCEGAYAQYGGNVLIVDFGSATTYDYIDEKGVFCAGAISVGIETGSNSLWSSTAQLPEVEIAKPKTILATNTTDEMQAGIFYLFLGGFEKTIEAFRQALNPDLKIVVTGGLGRVICKYTPEIDTYDPDLIFKGLKLIYEKNKGHLLKSER